MKQQQGDALDKGMVLLPKLLAETASKHPHLCPRQVLGVRIGLLAGVVLDIDVPQKDKRLFTIVETDGCFVDGIGAATNCWVGRRTLRLDDYGKVAATFVDTCTGDCVRILPRRLARELAYQFAPEAKDQWEAMLLGYQHMPDSDLLTVQNVQLGISLEKILSRAGRKVLCERCGEEIMNEREHILEGHTFCRACSGDSYYRLIANPNT